MVSEFVWKIIENECKDPELRKILEAHSRAVAAKALSIIKENALDRKVDAAFVEDASMLHDIGIVKTNAPSIHCHGELPYICHGIEGKKILDSYGLDERYGLVCMRHTGAGLTREDILSQGLPLPAVDMVPLSMEEKIICYADKFFSKSRDLEKEKSREEVLRSMARHGQDSVERFLRLEDEITGHSSGM